jgi:hypothetical protein
MRIAGTIFVLLPLSLALFIFLWSPEHTIYSFFAALAETALVAGIISNEEDTQMRSLMTVMGLLVALIVATIFSWQYGLAQAIVNFLIYWWVWLSLYSAGIQISLKYIDQNKLFESLIIVIGSIATLSWYWFSFFF